MFFDPRRYDLAKVGRYKFNKKLMLRNRIRGAVLAEDVIDTTTGELLAAAGTKVTAELADTIQNCAVPFVYVQTEERNVKVLSSMMVDLTLMWTATPGNWALPNWYIILSWRRSWKNIPRIRKSWRKLSGKTSMS